MGKGREGGLSNPLSAVGLTRVNGVLKPVRCLRVHVALSPFRLMGNTEAYTIQALPLYLYSIPLYTSTVKQRMENSNVTMTMTMNLFRKLQGNHKRLY